PLADSRGETARTVELAPGGHDVGARLEQPAEDVDVRSVSHVEDAVGVQGDDLLDVPGGDHARRADIAQRPGVTTGLSVRVHVQPDQLEMRVLDDGAQ